MVSVETLVLNRLIEILYTLNFKVSDAYEFRHGVTCLKMLTFENFCCSKFFNFVVVNFIISKM